MFSSVICPQLDFTQMYDPCCSFAYLMPTTHCSLSYPQPFSTWVPLPSNPVVLSHACAIPTGRVQPSMNLSHAVAVVLGELFSRRCGLLEGASSADVDMAAAAAATWPGPQLLRLPLRGQHSASGHPEGSSRGSVEGGNCSSGNSEDLTGGAGTSGRPACGGAVADGAVWAPQLRQRGLDDGGGVDKALLPASAQEVDLLIRKVAAVAEAVGMRGEEGHGGGNTGRWSV